MESVGCCLFDAQPMQVGQNQLGLEAYFSSTILFAFFLWTYFQGV